MPILTPPAPRINELTLYVNGVQKLLNKLDPKKANGPDTISALSLVRDRAGKLRVNDDFSLSAQRTDEKPISTTR